MGEIADSMIYGEACSLCGVYLGPATGFPRTCPRCTADTEFVGIADKFVKELGRPKAECPECKAKVAWGGLDQHRLHRHGRPLPVREGKVQCPLCERQVKIGGLTQHLFHKHDMSGVNSGDYEALG